jgi:hypothetical protein
MLSADDFKMILSNSWSVQIVDVGRLVLIDLFGFVFQMIPNFELMADTFVNFDIADIALLTLCADKWMHFIDKTCLVLALVTLVTLVGIPPNIGTTSTNLTNLRASTAHLLCLIIFQVVDRKIQETTWARGEKGVADLAILPPDGRSVALVLVVSQLLHLLLVCELEVADYNLALLFTAVVASQEVARVTRQVNNAQLVESFEQCVPIVSPDTE